MRLRLGLSDLVLYLVDSGPVKIGENLALLTPCKTYRRNGCDVYTNYSCHI